MTSELLPAVTVEPEGPARFAVLWLHGLGADGHDFAPVLRYLPLRELGARVVLPHAPSIPVSINAGYVMPAWYDIREGDLRNRHDEGGIRESAERIEALIAAQKATGLPAERILLVGFSQGGAMALHCALRHPERLAGVVTLSTYLLLPEATETERSPANHGLPVFAGHGTVDPVVVPPRGEAARDWLVERGHPVEWHTYRMGHEVCLPLLDDLGAWLRKTLSE